METPAWARAIEYVGFAVELAGFLLGTWRWRQLGRGQKAMTLWFGAAIALDILDVTLAPVLLTSQPLSSASNLISPVLALEGLAAFQSSAPIARRFRLVATAYALTWLILHLTVEPLADYSTYSAPLAGFVILASAAFVLFERAARGRTDALVDPAFLVAAGLCGGAVADVFRTLVAGLMVRDHPLYTLIYYSACNIIVALAELIIIRALLIQPRRATRPAV
jgi:hypothetical protein